MAMGTRKQRQRQEELWYRRDLAQAPGHPFYRRLIEVLEEAAFDDFCEGRCHKFYHEKWGRPSLAPGFLPWEFQPTSAIKGQHIRAFLKKLAYPEIQPKIVCASVSTKICLREIPGRTPAAIPGCSALWVSNCVRKIQNYSFWELSQVSALEVAA
jgi:hypothetical protein